MAIQQYNVLTRRDRTTAIYIDAMARMYGLVAAGIAVTGGTIWVGDKIGVGEVIFGYGWIGTLLIFGAAIGMVFAASAAANRGYIGLGTTLYIAFTAFEGFVLSPILTIFTTETIGVAFILTACIFLAMSLVGLTTKRDLSKLGPILFIGLFGAIAVSFVNIVLLNSDTLFLVVNLALLPIFIGLTVWETKQVKELVGQAAMQGEEDVANRVAVVGSIGLYLSALNIFLILLNLLGFASDD